MEMTDLPDSPAPAGSATVPAVPAHPRPRGRPRAFDRARALEQALTLFWERGYEGTSIADLTAVMGITPPSLYAAFGSKEALFREALSLYRHRAGGITPAEVADEPTAYAA